MWCLRRCRRSKRKCSQSHSQSMMRKMHTYSGIILQVESSQTNSQKAPLSLSTNATKKRPTRKRCLQIPSTKNDACKTPKPWIQCTRQFRTCQPSQHRSSQRAAAIQLSVQTLPAWTSIHCTQPHDDAWQPVCAWRLPLPSLHQQHDTVYAPKTSGEIQHTQKEGAPLSGQFRP